MNMMTPYQSEWPELLTSLQKWESCSREELYETLRSLVKLSLESRNRECISRDDIVTITSLLSTLAPVSFQLSWQPDAALLEGVKLLRNICAGLPSNQEMISESGFLAVAVRLGMWLSSDLTSDPIARALLKALLQLLGNVCVGRSFEQEVVWSLCFPDLFKQTLSSAVEEVRSISCMILHTCTSGSGNQREALCCSPEGVDVLSGVLGCLAPSQTSDWPCILMETLCEKCTVERLWTLQESSPSSLLTLLAFFSERVDLNRRSDISSSSLYASLTNDENVTFLTKQFQEHLQSLLLSEAAVLKEIFSTEAIDSSVVLQVRVATGLLKLVCNLSTDERVLLSLQLNSELLKATVAFLKELCRNDGTDASGKNVSRLSATDPTSADPSHPLYGVKRDLIRLVGNLTHHCRAVQEYMRESEAIPLILNQCTIDHQNPYITQWAVFAIRNLCEGNPANQQLIAGLERRGLAEQPNLQFGCEVEIGDDGKIQVKRKTDKQ